MGRRSNSGSPGSGVQSPVMGLPRIRVAVVDDEEAVRKALHRLVTAANCEALSFATGAEFLAALPETAVDCLVLDLQMPGMTGLEVLERLSAAQARLPTVIITAHDELGSEKQCRAAGAVAYLRKPLDGQVLLESISAAIDSKTRSERAITSQP